MENETLVFYGGEVKALGDGKIAGYLVRYGSPKDVDLEGDYFSKETDLGIEDGSRLPLYYQHGMDGTLKARKIGKGTVKFDDVGAWMEAQLEMRDEYEKALYDLADAGKLGFSSGAAGHLVSREQLGKSWHIKSWPIGEASLTPTPAEPRNSAMSIKSLLDTSKQAEVSDTDDADEKEEGTYSMGGYIDPAITYVIGKQPIIEVSKTTIVEETKTMENKEELQALLNETLKELIPDVVKSTVEETIKAMKPDVKAGVAGVEVIEDEADKAARLNPFKTLGEMCVAVQKATQFPHLADQRLFGAKSSGLNEATPSQGGFLVQQTLASGLLEATWGIGTVLQYFSPMAIGPGSNGMLFNATDETTRVDGSRGGGVLGYWLEEGGSKTATKPKFRQIDLKLKKVAAAMYATDELLEDAVALNSWIMRYVPDELRFKVEAAIIDGNGVGKPLGVLQNAAGSFISATRLNATQINDADIVQMWARRYTGVNDYVWFGNAEIGPYLHQMTLSTTPSYMPAGGRSGAPYATLMGRPYHDIEYCPALGTVGDLMLVSPSQYSLISKGGVEAASSIHVQFLNDETTFRFVYRVDGTPNWYSAVTPYKGSATVSPFVGLAATT